MNYRNEPNCYSDFDDMYHNSRKRHLAGNTHFYKRDDGGYGVIYYNTEVATLYSDRTVLRTGGWWTVTTKDRIERFTPWQLFSGKGRRLAGNWDGKDYLFVEGIAITNDGKAIYPKHCDADNILRQSAHY